MEVSPDKKALLGFPCPPSAFRLTNWENITLALLFNLPLCSWFHALDLCRMFAFRFILVYIFFVFSIFTFIYLHERISLRVEFRVGWIHQHKSWSTKAENSNCSLIVSSFPHRWNTSNTSLKQKSRVLLHVFHWIMTFLGKEKKALVVISIRYFLETLFGRACLLLSTHSHETTPWLISTIAH